jgi:hypothetical protein
MAIDFPNSPSVNDTFTVGTRTWIWDGTTWELVTTITGINLDGGVPSSNYGGINPLDGGTP